MSLIEPDDNFLPRIKVQFTRSSQRDGRAGYSIDVEEGAEETEALEVFRIAVELRRKAEDEIVSDNLMRQLEVTNDNLKGESKSGNRRTLEE